jgi:DNA polymerase-3 subunit gamma/tau
MSEVVEQGGQPQRASYLVLARKFRPRGFEELVGQEHVARALSNAIAQGRVAHAFLFAGARGVGKTSAARVLARALNCLKADGPTPEPCGVCQRCEEIIAGASVDVLEIDAASNRGIDDIRTLRESVRYLPAVARKKVVIVDEVHMLTTEAFNALLKTLEEPPAHVVFVLATTDPHKVPVTILSRCQRYDFKRVPVQRLVQHLEHVLSRENLKVARSGLRLIVRESEGSVRDALSLLDQVLSYAGAGPEREVSADQVAEVLGVADRSLVLSIGRSLCGRDVMAVLQAVDEGYGRGYDIVQLGRAVLAHLRDLTVIKLVPKPGALVDLSEEELAEAQAQLASVDASLIEQHFRYLCAALEEIAKSPDPRASLEMTLVRMARAEPLVPLGELVERLAQLEESLGGSTPAGPPGPGGSGGGRSAVPSAPASSSPGTARPAVRHAGPSSDQAASRPATENFVPDQAKASSAPNNYRLDQATTRPEPKDYSPDQAAPSAGVQQITSDQPAPSPTLKVDGAAAEVPPPSGCVEARAAVEPPAPATYTLADWEAIVIELRERKPALAAILETAHLLEIGPSALVVGFSQLFTYAQASTDDSVKALTATARGRLGAQVNVRVRQISSAEAAASATAASATAATRSANGPVERAPAGATETAPADSSPATLLDLDRRRQNDERDRRRREAQDHPLVRAALERFDAQIRDIKTDLD